MTLNLNGPPTVILIQGAGAPQFDVCQPILMGPLQQYSNGPQFKWAPNNNIDPGGLGLPTNLNGPKI